MLIQNEKQLICNEYQCQKLLKERRVENANHYKAILLSNFIRRGKINGCKKNVRRNVLSNNGKHQLPLFDYRALNNIKNIENEFGEKIVRVDGEIPVDLILNDGGRFLFISYDQSRLTHGLHKYPAKFFRNYPVGS